MTKLVGSTIRGRGVNLITDDCQVIAMTGSFGSGCTTAAKTLEKRMDFTNRRLSQYIRNEWQDSSAPTREDLQRKGDELRESNGPEHLAVRAISELADEEAVHGRIVIDGVRNLGEVEFLRDRFGYRFTLMAVLADADARWNRLSDDYVDNGMGESEFLDDDSRDKNEETPTGQQVELCIDASDVVLANDENVTRTAFNEKVIDYAERVMGLRKEAPTEAEIYMQQAASARFGSRCIKRQVGAVIVDPRNLVVGLGFNENPTGTKPCVLEPTYQAEGPCFRDMVRNNHFRELGEAGARCPVCGEPIGVIEGPPWRCPHCKREGDRTNLEQYFVPDRAMSRCTAIHAEDAAIFAAFGRTIGATLYCTTFPCMQCAEKIIHAGITRVVYTEAYPDTHGEARFELARVELRQFEGVKSSAFERVYGHQTRD